MKNLLSHYICKIEGHGSLKIGFKKGTARLNVEEGERLFESFLLDRNFQDAPFITSRICGVCPTVHNLTSINALEKAFDITCSKKTESLRKLMLATQIIQSHVLHLFFLALPDYLSLDSTLQFAERNPEVFQTVLNLKRTADKILETIGGRAVHPITTCVGGFSKTPNKEKLKELQRDLEKILPDAKEAIVIFSSFDYPKLERETEYLCLGLSEEYAFYNGEISFSGDFYGETEDYKEYIKEQIKDYSTAKFSERNGHGFMVGALTRLNLQNDKLNPKAKKALADIPFSFPSYNPFHNNLAQAIEILHFTEENINLIDEILANFSEETNCDYKIKMGQGVAALEAPRGTLYHEYKINSKGKITYCNIVTPTAQNLTNIEEDARELLKVTKDLSDTKRAKLLKMLVRAYDPCITCSVH